MVLVSREEAYVARESFAVVEVTTLVRGLATEVPLGRAEGLPRKCVANAEALHTLKKHRLRSRISRLPPDRVRRLDDALRFALALEA